MNIPPTLWPWQLDLRSLVLFRIMMALAMFWQLSWRVADFQIWYTESGFITTPLRDLIKGSSYSPLALFEPWRVSYYASGFYLF